MKVRKLSVLNLNDKRVAEFKSGSGKAKHFDVRLLRTWKQVQADIGGSDPFRPDIVLADIDFEEDSSVKSVEFPGCEGAKPIGPLLALPYVSSRAVWAFAMYSAHFSPEDEELSPVERSPWVLFPLGIMLAKGYGGSFASESLANEPLDDSVKTIEKFRMELELNALGSTGSAIEEAIELYSRRLAEAIDTGKVRVVNGDILLRYLRSLLGQFDEKGVERVKIDSQTHLALYSPSYGIDRIQWLSICADFVSFVRDDIDRKNLEDMISWAESIFGEERSVYEKVLDIFQIQDTSYDSDVDKHRTPFHSIATELYGDEDPDVKREILRLGALLANAHAWAKGGFQTWAKSDVAERLGQDASANPYIRFFDSDREDDLVCIQSLKVRKLDKYVSESNQSEPWKLEWGESILSDEDKKRIRTFLEIFQDTKNDGNQHWWDLPDELPYLDTTQQS